MDNKKKCSGCKKTLTFDHFYKNKLVLDGHSNYCKSCTKLNSKKYFQKKKEKVAKNENESLMKMVLLNHNSDLDALNADNLVKILMIENLCKSILIELGSLKKNYLKTENSEIS